MGVPRAHSTRGQKGRRRSHLALKKTGLVSCSHCHKPSMPHMVCKSCGFYDNKEAVNVLARELKRKEKQKK
ncbi:MAG: 50S ribosomal protein L32 [Candidatus Yanofskybacteria bacterium RIFCSPHIGHO2_01_FULL_44_17]|uniref:Large ribosomal subunit protein bL32 n=1 Tax=Candidatus Yanofskybacteria bacterium RIFCSPHIGHO2_01_FULL_44_17 TaxID=1802668 RepID=A0A1F8EWT5_9BACT|nr:MAG: 50S ribosomal protein L32 [Candidatus Yanofskybacteria bacterium RIFCSPHIGHO2_01_FULL_44_17]